MNEIVIKNKDGFTFLDIHVWWDNSTGFINAGYRDDASFLALDPDEARSMIDALCKVLNEPTREQCFEAGINAHTDVGYVNITDYINKYKKEK